MDYQLLQAWFQQQWASKIDGIESSDPTTLPQPVDIVMAPTASDLPPGKRSTTLSDHCAGTF